MVANQWALKWPYSQPGGALPVVNDTVPDPLARLTDLNGQRQSAAQDTGWSWMSNTLPGSVDYGTGTTSGGGGSTGQGNQGTSPFGYAYTAPPNLNIWGTYDGGEGYKGGDGIYNVAADTRKGWGPNGQGEYDRDRVWRMTLDAARAEKLDPGAQDPLTQARMKQLYLDQIARLHRDYRDTQGLGEQAWASSPFAAYDQYLAGGQPGTTTQQGGTRGAAAQTPAAPAIAGAAQALGGAATGGSGNQTGGNGVANPLAIDPSAGSGVLPGGGSVPGANSNQNPVAGMAGYAGLVNQGNPQDYVRQYMQQHGISPDTNMFFGDFIKKLFGTLVPTIMSLTLGQNGKPALDRLDNPASVLDPLLFGGAGTMGGNLRGFADQAQQGLMSSLPGMNASSQADLLRNLSALRTFGDNQYMQEATGNRLDAAIGSARDQAFKTAQTGGKMPDNWSLWDYIQNSLPQGYVNPFR